MMKRKIDVIVKYFYPVAAGIETNILETYSILAKNGWDITIHTSKDTLIGKSILPNREEIKGLKIKRYPFASEYFGFWPAIHWDKTDLICLHNFNIFFIRFFLFLLARKVLRNKNPKLVLTPHGGFNPDWSIFTKLTALAKALYHFTLGSLLINLTVDGVRAVSVWEKKEMIKKGLLPNKVNVISNGLENEAFENVDKLASKDIKTKVKKLGRYIIQIGRIYSIKNYETSLMALALTPDDLKYVIVGPVGDEKYKQELEKLISELHLKDRVIFWGVVRGIDKYYLIRHAKMMVHMALWESFCNVVHEAMSQGVPVIAADNTALPLLIKDGVSGYLVETKDYKKVAEKTYYILDKKNSREVKKISRASIRFTQSKTWEKTAEKMEKFYSSLL